MSVVFNPHVVLVLYVLVACVDVTITAARSNLIARAIIYGLVALFALVCLLVLIGFHA